MSSKKITRQLSIFINGKEVKNSLGGIGREIAKVKKLLKEANNPEDIKKYKAELDKLGKAYGDVKEEIHDTNDVLQDASGHWSNLMSGFLSGNLKQASSGLKGIAGNIKGITKAAKAFMATPLGATLAGLASIVFATKKWVDYNLEIAKTIKLTEQITGYTGQQLSELRASISATASTFDKDFNEVLRSTNALAKQMKISQEEALSLINQGFIRGADAAGGFLKKLEEYPIQFKNAGYSAQDFIDIATQEVKGGVYDDKLVDALKEANLALQEMTKSQSDALKNAFGKKFADEIAKGLKTGEITTKQAIDNIIKKSNELGLNYQQQQQIIADLFKGAGEDAGGFAEIILQLNEAFKEENKTLNKNEEATKRLVEANQDYEKAVADLFDASSSGFPAMLTGLKAIGTEILTNILGGLKSMFTSIEQLKRQAGLEGTAKAVKDVSDNMKDFGTTAAQETKYMVDASIDNIARLKSEIEKVGFFDLLGKKDALKVSLAKEKSYLNELKLIAQEKSQEFIDYQAQLKEGSKILKLNKNNGNDTSNVAKLKAAKKLADQKTKIFEKGEKELNDLIKKIQEDRLLNSKSSLEKELLTVDQKYEKLKEKFILSEEDKNIITEEQEIARNEKLKELDHAARLEKEELKITKDAEFREQLKEIEQENRILDEEARFEREAETAASDQERQLILLQKAKYVADQQVKIEREKELAKVKEYENAEKLRVVIRKKYDKKQAKTDKDFAKAETELRDDRTALTKLAEDQKLQKIKETLNGISDAFNKGSDAWKATKIAETTIATFQSAVSSYNGMTATIPGPIGIGLGIAAAAASVVSGMKQVSNISNTKLQKMPKHHYFGGRTGEKAIYHDQYGAVTGVVHDNEWVAPKFMTESPRYAPTIQWLDNERKRELGQQYFDGGKTSETSTPAFETEETTNPFIENQVITQLTTEISRLNTLISIGITTGPIIIGDDELEQIKERTSAIATAYQNAKIQ